MFMFWERVSFQMGLAESGFFCAWRFETPDTWCLLMETGVGWMNGESEREKLQNWYTFRAGRGKGKGKSRKARCDWRNRPRLQAQVEVFHPFDHHLKPDSESNSTGSSHPSLQSFPYCRIAYYKLSRSIYTISIVCTHFQTGFLAGLLDSDWTWNLELNFQVDTLIMITVFFLVMIWLESNLIPVSVTRDGDFLTLKWTRTWTRILV